MGNFYKGYNNFFSEYVLPRIKCYNKSRERLITMKQATQLDKSKAKLKLKNLLKEMSDIGNDYIDNILEENQELTDIQILEIVLEFYKNMKEEAV